MNARLLVAAVFGLSGSAMGQYALDHSLQQGSGGRNAPGRDFKQEVEFRNAIVTGNAAGGISFRGDVGYRAPGEFFGHLGSNDTFAFRRDSAFSGLGGVGLRGTDALQYQFAVTTGNELPSGLTGMPIYGRSGSGTPPEKPGTQPNGFYKVERPHPGDPGFDTRGLSLMSVRSPSSYMANQGLEPTLLGRGDTDTEARAVTASMLRGVAYDDIGVLGLRKPAAEPKAPPPTAAPSTAIDTGAPTALEKPVAPSTELHTAYDDLLKRLDRGNADTTKAGVEQKPGDPQKPGDTQKPGDSQKSREGSKSGDTQKQGDDKKTEDAKQSGLPDWQKRLDALRDRLKEKNRPGDAKPGAKPQGPAHEGEPKTDEVPSDLDTAALIKRAGDKVSALADPSFDPYGSQMNVGQEHLAAGRYFDAEERFTAALSAKPGDPMAMVGRIHAQLGAGMFLSASINLRGLLVEHPELAGMKYSEQLLPVRERKGLLVDRLGELISEGGGHGRDPGLLMAYLGYQIGDKAVMQRGLDAMTAGAPPEQDQLSRLAALLRQVWADGEAPATEPKKK